MEQLTYRHDQMELKANCLDYKKFQGIDTVYEFIQALKHLSYYDSSNFDIEHYNPSTLGYLQLVHLSKNKNQNGTSVLVDNRFDYLSDGVTLNGYEKLRRL